MIVGPASPLFARKAMITPADLRGALAKAPLAVPSIDSAAGYLFPLLTLAAEPYGVSRPGQFLFCYSDTDVVANVVWGLAPFGAWREGGIAATLAGTADAGRSTDSLGRYCRVLLQTARFPTDPILIRDDILPSRTDVGRELKPVLREFFNTQAFDRDLRVEDAVPRAYESIERALDRMARVSAAQQTTTSATAKMPSPAAAAPAATSTTATTPTNPSARSRFCRPCDERPETTEQDAALELKLNRLLAALALAVLIATLWLLAWLRQNAAGELDRVATNAAAALRRDEILFGPGGDTLVRFRRVRALIDRSLQSSSYIRGAVVTKTVAGGGEHPIYPVTWWADHRERWAGPLADWRKEPLGDRAAPWGYIYLDLNRSALRTINLAIGAVAVSVVLMLAALLARLLSQESSLKRTVIELNDRRRELIRIERLALAASTRPHPHDLRKPYLNIRHSL